MADIVTVQDEGNQIVVVQGNDYTVCNIIESGVEIEKLSFLQLNDTPSSYEKSAGYTVRVNATMDGLEFGKSYNTFLSLDDTPSSYANNTNKLLAVNQAGNGISFINYSVGDVNIEYFTQLADVPASYVDQKEKLPVVKEDESGLEFKDIDDVLPNQAQVVPGSYRYPQITIDQKGRITLVQEGKPFEFDPFEPNRLLVGDGSTIPAQVSLGLENQILLTNAESAPSWIYLNKLYDNNRVVLEVKKAAEDDASKLVVVTSSSNIKLTPEDPTQEIIIGPYGELLISDQYIELGSEVVIKNNSGITVDGDAGLRIDPGSSTVGIKNVAVNNYNERIGLNDFITRSWYESQDIPVPSGTYLKTAAQPLQGGTLVFSIPNHAVLKSVSLDMQTAFNNEASIRVYDSLTNELMNSEDSPMLDEDTEIIINHTVNADGYQVYVTIEGYSYGYADCYLTYFTA